MLRPPRHLRPLGPRRAGALGGLRCGLLCGLLFACALPSDPLSGLEVSWSLTEREASDGESGRRMRTCAGGLVRRVELDLRDLSDDGRHEVFSYACEVGYQTPDEVATLPTSAFFDLREGDYELTVRAISDLDGGAQALAPVPVTIPGHGVERLTFDLAPPLSGWLLELAGADACLSAAATLRYADPAAALVGAGESGASADDARYRADLVGDGGLTLGGVAEPCSGAWASEQRFALDPGDYVLEIVVDGVGCEIPVLIPPSPPVAEGEAPAIARTTTLDLAKLPCAG